MCGVANPDVTQDNIHQTICVPGFSKTVRPPSKFTTELKAAQLGVKVRVRGKMNPILKRYEEDHCWAIENGGNPIDPGNLMPQLWTGKCNARQKDRVENVVHKLICSDSLTLEDGYAEQSDWKAAYRKYVNPKGCE